MGGYTSGVNTLQGYTLGVWTLGTPILNLVQSSLGVYTLGGFTLGLDAQATDLGFGPVLIGGIHAEGWSFGVRFYEHTPWGSRRSGDRV